MIISLSAQIAENVLFAAGRFVFFETQPVANRKFKTWSRRGEHAQQRTTNSAAGLRPTFCRPRTRQASSHPHSQTRMEPRRYVKKSTLKYRRYILFVFFFFLLSYVPTGHSSSATSLLHERVSFEEQGGHLLLSIFVCVCVCFQCPPPHSTHAATQIPSTPIKQYIK